MSVTPATLTRAPSDDGSSHYVPYGFDRATLDDFDYVEEEWFASGEEDGHPYETTVLVRRPRNVGRFSGTVLAEPVHLHGIAPIWMYAHPYVMRSGHGWVAIASQKASLDTHVKPSNAERYRSLHLDGPDTPFDQNPPFEDPEKAAAFWADLRRFNRASTNVLAQVGAALRGDGGPFDGWPVDHVLLVGHSQTGSVTTEYILDAHEAQRRADGSPVFDGYFPSGFPATPFGGYDVPIVQVLSEGDVPRDDNAFFPGNEGRRYRRDDSDEPGDRFRLYELANVPHMGTRHSPYDDVELWRVQHEGFDVPPGGRMNSLPHNELFHVTLDHLVRWVAEGVTPPRADRLEVGPDGFFVKDDHGHSLGGVRCVQVDVPRTRYFANPLNPDGTPMPTTIAAEQPFDDQTLKVLYPEPDDYTERFERRLQELVAEGWLLPEDADEMRRELSTVS
jgi:Alpha/beta hydrolase domain